MAIQHLSYGLLLTTVLIALFGFQPSDALCWPKVKFFDPEETPEDCVLKLPKPLELKDLFKDKKDDGFDSKIAKYFDKDENVKYLDKLLKLDDLKDDYEDKKEKIKAKEQKNYDLNDKLDYIKEKIDYDLKDKVSNVQYVNIAEKPYKQQEKVVYYTKEEPYAPKEVSYVPQHVTYIQKEVPYVQKEIPYVQKQVSYSPAPYVTKPAPQVVKEVPYVSHAIPHVQSYGVNKQNYNTNDHGFYTQFLQENVQSELGVEPSKLCDCSNNYQTKPPCCFNIYYI